MVINQAYQYYTVHNPYDGIRSSIHYIPENADIINTEYRFTSRLRRLRPPEVSYVRTGPDGRTDGQCRIFFHGRTAPQVRSIWQRT